MPICAGDAVLVSVNEERTQRIGVIRFIGRLNGESARCVGVNLLESIEDGHNGTIDGISYFKAPHGHGIFVSVPAIKKKLSPLEITTQMQQMIQLFKTRLNQYLSALSERDDYIKDLKSTVLRLKKKLHTKKKHNIHKSYVTLQELACTPPPMDTRIVINGQKRKKRQKQHTQLQPHAEYTKYNEAPPVSPNEDPSSPWGSDDSNTSTSGNEDAEDQEEEDESSANSAPIVSEQHRPPKNIPVMRLNKSFDRRRLSGQNSHKIPPPRHPQQKRQVFVHNQQPSPHRTYHMSPVGTYPNQMQHGAPGSARNSKNMQQFHEMMQYNQNYVYTPNVRPISVPPVRTYPRGVPERMPIGAQTPPRVVRSHLAPHLVKKRSSSVDLGQYNMYHAHAQNRNQPNNLRIPRDQQYVPQNGQQRENAPFIQQYRTMQFN
eukprot:1038481_1